MTRIEPQGLVPLMQEIGCNVSWLVSKDLIELVLNIEVWSVESDVEVSVSK